MSCSSEYLEILYSFVNTSLQNHDFENVLGVSGVIFLDRRHVNGASVTEPFNVVLSDSSPFIAEGVTIVVVGGNVWIDQNITKPLGLVVMKDRSIPTPHGNINICGKVTEIHGEIRSEGSLLSYGSADAGGVITCGDKTTDPDDGFSKITGEIRRVLRNQLSFFGSVSSLNTSGGATQTFPLMADGTVLSPTSENFKKAKRTDLNFLRYANVTENTAWRADAVPPRLDKVWWTESTAVSPSLGSNRGQERDIDVPPNFPPKYGIINFFQKERANLPLLK